MKNNVKDLGIPTEMEYLEMYEEKLVIKLQKNGIYIWVLIYLN